MKNRFLRMATTLLICMMLSSCTGFNPVTTNLMRPPRLTAEQKAIDDALKASVIANPILKYPKGGDYRSAFVFHDIDRDGVEEAIVFYSVESNDYARVVVLDLEDGQWRAIHDRSGEDRDVEFIAFANITSIQKQDILIGWSNPNDIDMTLGIYSYEDNRLVKQVKDNANTIYNEYLIDDLDQDGLNEIFLLNRESGNRAKSSWLKQIAFDGYAVDTIIELPLSDSISEFKGVIAGGLSPESKQRGLFIDELLGSGILVTEVFALSNGTIAPIIEQDMGAPTYLGETGEIETNQPLVDTQTLYDQTRREELTAVCRDINEDGIIEIPTARLMPGYEDDSIYDAEKIYLTEYNQLNQQGLQRVMAAAVNRAGGYRVEFPLSWIDTVTVVNQIESGEWRFFKYNDSLNNLSEELLRIRVVSQKDYQDKFLDSYFTIATRGQFTYYGYIPQPAESPLAVSDMQLKQTLFSLL